MVECGRAFGLSKDAIKYRVTTGDTRIFPERKQILLLFKFTIIQMKQHGPIYQ